MFSCVKHDASSKSEACLVDFYQEISTTSTVSLQTLTNIKIDRVKINPQSNKMLLLKQYDYRDVFKCIYKL